MSDMRLSATRLRSNDVLIVMLQELQDQAPSLNACDADEIAGWFHDAALLLSEIPNVTQRLAWALLLADRLPSGSTAVFPTAQSLLTLAGEVKDARHLSR